MEINRADLMADAIAVDGVDIKLQSLDVVAISCLSIIKRVKKFWGIPAEILKRRKTNFLDMKTF